jgi:hypothetical protein
MAGQTCCRCANSHAVWTVPPGDCDLSAPFAGRGPSAASGNGGLGSISSVNADDARHVDYGHINPLEHGLVERLDDWPYSSSSLHRDVGNRNLVAALACQFGRIADMTRQSDQVVSNPLRTSPETEDVRRFSEAGENSPERHGQVSGMGFGLTPRRALRQDCHKVDTPAACALRGW